MEISHMSEFAELIFPNLIEGLTLSILALGLMIPYRILHFPDLTSEGSYPFGGALCATMILYDIHPGFAILCAFIGGGLLGSLTSVISIKLRLNSLLAGILVSNLAYSLNFRMMGRTDLAIFELENLFSATGDELIPRMIILLCLNILIFLPILMYFYTERGLIMRSVGANKKFSRLNGFNVTLYTILGMFLANGLCALAGGLLVQIHEYVNISQNLGIVIHALAAVMIGEVIIRPDNMVKQFMAPFVGAIIYHQIQGFALFIGFAHPDLKFLTGFTLLIVLIFRKIRNK